MIAKTRSLLLYASPEKRMAWLYRRIGSITGTGSSNNDTVQCDAYYDTAYNQVTGGKEGLREVVSEQVEQEIDENRATRADNKMQNKIHSIDYE
jgi:hypothetical protein